MNLERGQPFLAELQSRPCLYALFNTTMPLGMGGDGF